MAILQGQEEWLLELTRQDDLDQNPFFSACGEHTFFAIYQCSERGSKSQGFSSVAQCITVLVLVRSYFEQYWYLWTTYRTENLTKRRSQKNRGLQKKPRFLKFPVFRVSSIFFNISFIAHNKPLPHWLLCLSRKNSPQQKSTTPFWSTFFFYPSFQWAYETARDLWIVRRMTWEGATLRAKRDFLPTYSSAIWTANTRGLTISTVVEAHWSKMWCTKWIFGIHQSVI